MNMTDMIIIANIKECLINKGIFSDELWDEIMTIIFNNDEKNKPKDKKIQLVITGI